MRLRFTTDFFLDGINGSPDMDAAEKALELLMKEAIDKMTKVSHVSDHYRGAIEKSYHLYDCDYEEEFKEVKEIKRTKLSERGLSCPNCMKTKMERSPVCTKGFYYECPICKFVECFSQCSREELEKLKELER